MKKMVLVLVMFVLLAAGYLYYVQYEFGIQIPKVNPITGDTCGIVVYHSLVLDFSSWDPHQIDGYSNPDIIPDKYVIGNTWGGLYSNLDGSTGFGFGFLNGYCFVETDGVIYHGEFMHSLPQGPRYRVPFVLP